MDSNPYAVGTINHLRVECGLPPVNAKRVGHMSEGLTRTLPDGRRDHTICTRLWRRKNSKPCSTPGCKRLILAKSQYCKSCSAKRHHLHGHIRSTEYVEAAARGEVTPPPRSQYRGVTWYEQRARWRAHYRRTWTIGWFETEEGAARAWDAYCKRRWKNPRYLNFPDER